MELLGLWQSGMVLARERKNVLLGVSQGEWVQVRFLQQVYTLTPGAGGRFALTLPPLSPGGPHDMEVLDSHGGRAHLCDIYIGDLWLLGGQSNMQMPILRTLDKTGALLEGVRPPAIRQYTVEQITRTRPEEGPPAGRWMGGDTEEIFQFSAAGYCFAREIYSRMGVPIGLIQTAIGGTPVESWMSEETLEGFSEIYHRYSANTPQSIQAAQEDNLAALAEWERQLNRQDQGLVAGWSDAPPRPEFHLSLPGELDAVLPVGFSGSVWLWKEIEIPEGFTPREVQLGTLVDADECTLNGHLCGQTGYRYPPRNYPLPSGVVVAGKNRLVLRLVVNRGGGGVTEGKTLRLLGADGAAIDLSGCWQGAVGAAVAPAPAQYFPDREPGVLYNGMIKPLEGTPLAGVLFYQGETNSGAPAGYTEKFKAMITCWRALFNNPTLPFFYVQLANYNDPFVKGGFAAIREQQRLAEDTPHTGMVVAIDLGEYNDLHPQDKKTLGERLALLARAQVYNQAVCSHGPGIRSASREGAQILLRFSEAEGGLVWKGEGVPDLFVVLENGQRERPDITTEGACLRLSCKQAIAVEYACHDQPQGALLYNGTGLPASPFVIAVQSL